MLYKRGRKIQFLVKFSNTKFCAGISFKISPITSKSLLLSNTYFSKVRLPLSAKSDYNAGTARQLTDSLCYCISFSLT